MGRDWRHHIQIARVAARRGRAGRCRLGRQANIRHRKPNDPGRDPPPAGRWAFGFRALLIFAASALAGMVVAVVVPGLGLRRRIISRMTRRIFERAGVPVVIEGAEHLAVCHACIVVANHTSNLDAVALLAYMPPHIRFVAKRSFATNPLTAALMRGLGCIFVRRYKRGPGPGSTRDLVEAVRQGHSLLVFPEGAFRRVPGLWPFRMGAFVAAAETGTPVVPIAIHGARHVLPAKHLLAKPGTIRLVVAPPIYPADPSWASAQRLRDAAYAAILQRCGEPPVTALDAAG